MKIMYYIAKLIKYLHISAILNSDIHKTSKVGPSSHLVNTTIKRYSYIGSNCTIVNVDIGAFCSIANNIVIGGGIHPLEWVSTSPVFHNGNNIMKKNFTNHVFKTTSKTVIGNDVWIGNNCLIKGGVTIGDGAVIGMGSVVTKNIGDYEIWAGNPAKIIRKRFKEDTIEGLLKIKWWEWDDEKIEQDAFLMNNVNEFVFQFKNKETDNV